MSQSRPHAPDFLILGAGAMGTIFGAYLARAGHSVAMLVRERRAEQIRTDGLRVTGLEDFTVQVPVLTDASQLRRAGVLVVAMKTLGTAAALGPLRHVHFDGVLSLQNGAFKNDRLVEAFGRHAVIGALSDASGELRPDGSVLFTRNVMTLVGDLEGDGARAAALASLLERAGIRTRAVPDITGREWSKFCGWAGYMTMAVATRAVSWKVVLDADGARLIARVAREMAALAAARGITLSDDSMLPIVSMARGTEEEAAAAVIRKNEAMQATAPLHRMSSLQDFEAGRPLELEETVAVALREGRAHGVPMPTLDALYLLCRTLQRIQQK
ncbi:MAG: 2-dehydropantoate 2-reductase [Pseudomonadota bacterium]|nr:2-dehydropantoate 2-reductase [Pseudomonadota bacterium]